MGNRFQLPPDGNQDRINKLVSNAINFMSDQANVDPTSAQVATPPAVSNISVTESGGFHDVSIQDNSPAYRAVKYAAWYSRSPDMQNAHMIDLGQAQNHRKYLGSGKYYWAATSKYDASDHSPMVFHGGTSPQSVGSGAHVGPPMSAPQGFSTQYRASNTPPSRK